MYELNDTIAVVSSPTTEQRVIIRITGPETVDTLRRIFSPRIPENKAGLISGCVTVDAELQIDAKLYLFLAPHSYTAETLAEIHVHTNSSTAEALMAGLLAGGLRMAGPGEFTARAYLNGKIDLTQAEAVAEIVASSNKLQLAAAEKLLAGRLAQATTKIRSSIMDCLSLIEAGLDFSGEDIEFISAREANERLTETKAQLQQLLSGSISYESIVTLPTVGIAGVPNAGKSSLLNKLLGKPRSIVSERRKTTRDVVEGLLTLTHCRCVLFDCAGLMLEVNNILDELTQAAATGALNGASLVVFCVDISKTDWSEDIAIRKLIEPKIPIAVATKSDLMSEDLLAERLAELGGLFGADFLAASTKTGAGIELLREVIDRKIIAETTESTMHQTQYALRPLPAASRGVIPAKAGTQYEIALTARHKQAVTEAAENISESINELKIGNDEVAAMMLRAAYQGLSNIESEHVDEQILEKIFSHFCIGK